MSRYKVWNVGAGAVELQVKPLALFVMMPDIRVAGVAGGAVIPFRQVGGLWTAAINAQTVADLRAAHAAGTPLSLLFSCGAAKSPGGGNKWGWGMRVGRGAGALPAEDDKGAPLALDADGFVRTALRDFPQGKSVAMGFDIITFA